MDQSPSFQTYFFDLVKSKTPGQHSLVDEIAEILNVSNDSAYRRIRGEKILDLNEVDRDQGDLLCNCLSDVLKLPFRDASNSPSTLNFVYNEISVSLMFEACMASLPNSSRKISSISILYRFDFCKS